MTKTKIGMLICMTLRQLPVQQELQVDIGINGRAHHDVVRVGRLVVFLPSERRTEIPFVIQGQAGSQSGNPGTLKDIYRQGISQFLTIVEGVIPDTDSLNGIGIPFAEIRLGRKPETVFQVAGEHLADGLLRGVFTFEKSMGLKNVPRSEVGFQQVHDFPGPVLVVSGMEAEGVSHG